MDISEVEDLFEKSYDIYGFMYDILKKTKGESQKVILFQLGQETKNTKIKFLISFLYYFLDEIEKNNISKVMSRIESFDKYFFYECYF